MAAHPTGNPPDQPAGETEAEEESESPTSSVAHRVFWPSAVVILLFVLYAVLFPHSAASAVTTVQDHIIGYLGWYYQAIVSLFVIFSIWVGVSRFGDIKLGRDEEEPEFGLLSWLSMLFAAGMGIGLVFWGVAEPLTFYDEPKPGIGESSAARSEFAMRQTFLHWGVHPWAIYAVVGLAVAYAIHRRGRPVSIRWTLEPLIGERVKGGWGDLIDVIAIIGTLFGVATSLGFGVMQVSAGMEYSGWVDSTGEGLQVLLIVVITLIAIGSVVSGLGRGIRLLSNVNITIAALLMIFVLVTGPTEFIFNTLVQSIGNYLQNFLQMSFDTGVNYGSEGTGWVRQWTLFYWGWWISWVPFVGIFIARISRGRTVREFIAGVLLVPTVVTFLWYSALGGSALWEEIFGSGNLTEGGVNTDAALFQLLHNLPWTGFVSGVTILLIVLFFVTSSDSGSFVVDMLASGGDQNPPIWSRVFWSVAEGAVAIALLLAGGAGSDSLTTLQTTAIIIALPFSVIMLIMCVATLRCLRAEHRAYEAARRREMAQRLVHHTVNALEENRQDEAAGRTRAWGEYPRGSRRLPWRRR
ncbi:BCCT family transporter [Streptomyces xiaopingdaonensis]|uniref:BCCT family transporter n=1 Tax=Streptomyces xiaopingdaonensis TaxID=1565415 RepID=UPI0002E081D5|nr:BCCT family transporter [Streptomyces xiaopingdaonensis]